jgi:NADPH:quinone reductase-like Zn-dependent oxidoreductase
LILPTQASTVSNTDCTIRQGSWWGTTTPPLPNTPGVDVVGRIHSVAAHISKKFGWNVGDRIMSMVKWGGNTRFLLIDPAQAIAVPEAVDPASAVCLIETYLAAFQVLHYGQTSKQRYRDDSLQGKSILLRGFSVSSMGRAIAQLAAIAGASNVFAVAKRKHFSYLTSLDITPLDNDGKDWWKMMSGKVDLIVTCDEDSVDIPFKLLKGNGFVIAMRNFGKNSRNKKVSSIGKGLNICCRRSRLQRNRISTYDVYEEWDTNLDLCKSDLKHLLYLLETKVVEPTILDRIPLNKVDDAQGLVATKRLSGFIVCEPWLVGKSRTVCL